MVKRTETVTVAANPTRSQHTTRFLLMAPILTAGMFWAADVLAQDTTVSHGFSFLGELNYAADFTHLDYVNPDAPKGGELAQWTQGSFDSFNPYSRQGASAWGASLGFERIMDGVADDISASYCLLCETLEYPEDHSWVIFTIRPEARFSDGSPLTAEDVAFTHELFMEQGLVSFREGVSRIISGVEVLDGNRVKYTFTEDSPKRDRISQAGASGVFSKAWYESTGARLDEPNLDIALMSGAYVLDSYDINRQIIYKLNPDYWGKELPLNIGRNNFGSFRVEYFSDTNAAFEGFKSGAYTYRNENSSKVWGTQYDFPALSEGHVVKVELSDGTMASGQSFVFNMRKEKFQDIRVREAIGLMFNFEWSNDVLFYGLYARINSFAENSYLAAEGLPTPDELAHLQPLVDQGLLSADILTTPPVDGAASGTRQLDRNNLRAASALLDDAGWVVGDDGMRRNAAGETLKVEFMERSASFDRVINPYVDNLRKLGVDAVLNRIDNAQWIDRRYAFDYDMVNASVATGYEPGSGLEQSMGSKEADVSVFNPMGLKSPAVDALIDTIRNIETTAELIPAVKALDRVLRAERFWVPQWFKDVHTVAYFDMFEHPETLPPFALGVMDFWWYNADKADALKAAGALR